MGLITTIDAGEHTGWAQGRDGFLISCGYVHVLPDRPLSRIPHMANGLAVIEKPVHRREGETVDPNKMITLGIKVGRAVETYLVFGNEVRIIKPTDWKGSTPKKIQNARDQEKLTENERVIVSLSFRSIAAGYQNNVWDAIGIFLWVAQHITRDRT